MVEGIPLNPVNESNYVHKTMEDEVDVQQFAGWIYNPQTGQIQAGEKPRNAK